MPAPTGSPLRLLLLATTVACGGGGASAPAPAAAPAQAKSRLTLGEGKVTWSGPGDYAVVAALHADGAVDMTATYRETKDGPQQTSSRRGTLSPGGELAVDGKVIARLADSGAVSVLHESEVVERGVVVKSDASWHEVGVLDPAGAFTSAGDGRRIEVGPDGILTGGPPGLTIKVDVPSPAQRRAAVFLVIAAFAASKQTTTSDGPGKDAPAPAPAPAPEPAPAPPAQPR